eukprot:TRINITY_DN22_c0_g3_i1.p1 TRINITY_DN22_c0_g3~~TRINITY_DN22_c0_g3_i1.p1  ORF type:complete len:190 (-),score=33.06 TRINITY_DN22_c0_g3_i1:109-678(-)
MDFEDETTQPPVQESISSSQPTYSDAESDFISSGGDFGRSTESYGQSEEHSDFSAPTTNTSTSFEPAPTQSSSESYSYEETPLSVYRAEHDKKLDEKARRSEEKREKIISEANDNINQFYHKRDEQKEKNRSTNRTNEKTFVADRDAVLSGSASSNEWARVATLVDFKTTTTSMKDTSRMRKILIDLKH